MAIGARTRGILLVLPVTGQLLLLAGVGIVAPQHISGISEATLGVLSVAIGLASTVALTSAAWRCHGRLRLSWAAMALACGTWSAALFGAVEHWPSSLVWGLLRGLALGAVTVAVLLPPGVRRTTREWGLLLLDGWLVGVSAFLIVWVALRLTTSTLTSGNPLPPALFWVPLDLFIASTVTGLAIRTAAPRAPTTLLVLASLLTVTSDTTWALTVHPEPGSVTPFGVIEWLIALTALGSSTLTRHLNPWSSAVPVPQQRPPQPRLTRLAQMSMVPGLLAAAAPGADLMTFIAAAGLIIGLAVEVALTRRQHQDLWRALQGQAQRLAEMLQESRDAIVRLDPAGRIEFANDAVTDVFGHPAARLLGTSWYDLVLPDDRDAMVAQFSRLDDGEIVSGRIAGRFRHGAGGWRELESTASRREGGTGFTLSVRDVSERSRLEADLRRQASTDGLTGLFNRQAFITLLEERLPRGDTHMLFLDLDGFKAVNDTDGHIAGDRLLCQVADALRDELRPGDIAARFGGDEFAVLPAVRDLEGTRALAARLVERIGALSTRQDLRIGASIGVTDGWHDDAETLIRRADLAMYQAKADGGGQFVVHADPHQHPPHPGPAPHGGPYPEPAHPRPAHNPEPALVDLLALVDSEETKRA